MIFCKWFEKNLTFLFSRIIACETEYWMGISCKKYYRSKRDVELRPANDEMKSIIDKLGGPEDSGKGGGCYQAFWID